MFKANKKINLSSEEKSILNGFMTNNYDFIRTSNFEIYDNIKLLGDLLEEFLSNNEIEINNLRRFLMEIRGFQFNIKTNILLNDIRSKRGLKVPNSFTWANERVWQWFNACSVVNELNKGISYKIRNAFLNR